MKFSFCICLLELLIIPLMAGLLGPEGEKQHRVQAGDLRRCLQEAFWEGCGV